MGIRKMQGMNLASLRHHVALQPLAIIMVGGMLFVGAYIGRLASKTTDVNWTEAKDLGDHMGYYKARQFQWFNPSGKDYDKIAADRVARGEVNYREQPGDMTSDNKCSHLHNCKGCQTYCT